MEVSAEESAWTLREHGFLTILCWVLQLIAVLFGWNWDTLGPQCGTSRELDSSNLMGYSLGVE